MKSRPIEGVAMTEDRERAEQLYYGTYPVDAEGYIEALDSNQIIELMTKFGEAARCEELSRTREYLRKLAWSDADIAAWENWRGK